LDVAAVLDRCIKLERDGQERQRNLQIIERAYAGDYQERQRRGHWKKIFGGSDLSDLYYDDEKQTKLRIVVNLLKPMAEAKRGLIGKMPDVRVPVNGIDPATQMLADANELRIRAMWRESKMKRMCGDMGFYLPIHGDCVGYVDLDFETKKVKLGVRSSRGFYAVPADSECIKIAEAVFTATYSGLHAAALFGKPELEGYTNVKVYEYWNKDQHSYVTQAWEKGFLINNKNLFTPLVPLVVFPNIAIPGSLYGDSDIEQGIELVKEFNRRYSIETEAIVRTLFAPWIVKNPLQVPKEISLDPYSVIPVGEGGDVRPAQPAQIPYQWMQGKNELRGLINTVTGTPSALTGEMDSQIVTAKAFNASLGPMNAQMEVRNQYIHDGIEMLNMLGLKAQCEIFGDEKQKTFAMTADGSQYGLEYFGKEIEGYYENEVYVPGSSFIDEQTAFMQTQASLNQGRMSKRTAMRLDPNIPNVEDELNQIDQEKLHDAQIMAQAQQMMAQASQGPPPPGGPPTGDPSAPPTGSGSANPSQAESDLYAAERGGSPAGVAPPAGESLPGGEAALSGPPLPTAGSPLEGMGAEPQQFMEPPAQGLSSVARAVVDEFRDIAAIPQGNTVFLTGPVLQGVLAPHSCEVYLSDMNDKATVVNHMKKSAPEIHGNMDFYQGMPPADLPSIDVSPGSEGYDLSAPGENPADSLGTPPGASGPSAGGPDMASMMGNLPPEMASQVGGMMGQQGAV